MRTSREIRRTRAQSLKADVRRVTAASAGLSIRSSGWATCACAEQQLRRPTTWTHFSCQQSRRRIGVGNQNRRGRGAIVVAGFAASTRPGWRGAARTRLFLHSSATSANPSLTSRRPCVGGGPPITCLEITGWRNPRPFARVSCASLQRRVLRTYRDPRRDVCLRDDLGSGGRRIRISKTRRSSEAAIGAHPLAGHVSRVAQSQPGRL